MWTCSLCIHSTKTNIFRGFKNLSNFLEANFWKCDHPEVHARPHKKNWVPIGLTILTFFEYKITDIQAKYFFGCSSQINKGFSKSGGGDVFWENIHPWNYFGYSKEYRLIKLTFLVCLSEYVSNFFSLHTKLYIPREWP